MKNPIPMCGIFTTPDNLTELFLMLDNYNGAEKALAMQVAMITLNTCSKLVDEMKEVA